MRFTEICNKDNEIHFIKFMFDKAWHLIQKEAEHQQQLAIANKEIQKTKERNNVLKKRMTRNTAPNYSAMRPLVKNKPKLY